MTGAEPDEALGIAYRLTAAIVEDSPARIAPLYDLCLAHLLRAAHHGEDDLRAAVGYWRQLRPLVAADNPARAEIFGRAAILVSKTVLRLADAAGVEEVIADLGIAIDGIAECELRDHPMLTRAQLRAARFRELGGGDEDRQHTVETLTDPGAARRRHRDPRCLPRRTPLPHPAEGPARRALERTR
ncbi:hypothetical protein [Saccharopolyspora spinosa]|uniref:Uncharacterized protein n=1 Tax=Saccharopolyspora spinosa TaxID=60894 RepID=A0A2N3Y1Y1_SACSN|nr:hypothetical protein [Saccharopolyspora spinosa]PKW16900.1 hypothetical protein A8926_4806 [Saccharopolyspora spinosa]